MPFCLIVCTKGFPPKESNSNPEPEPSTPTICKGVDATATVAGEPFGFSLISNNVCGAVVPIPILPEVLIRILSDWLPVLKMIASVVPLPDVLSSVRVDAAPVPPITRGSVMFVVKVGVAVKAITVPEPDVV